MKPIRRKAAAAAGKAGRGPVTKSVPHGPNLNLPGTPEPADYGHDTLGDIGRRHQAQGEMAGGGVQTFQCNHEGARIDRVHVAPTEVVRFIGIKPAGFTYARLTLRDALVFAVDRLGG